MFRFLLYKIGQAIVNILPINAAYRFAAVLSSLQYAFSFIDRRNVRSNLSVLLKTNKVDERLVWGVFRNFGRYLVDFFRMVPKVDQSFIDQHVQIQGLQHLRQVLGKGKGAILVSAHIGNWELGAVVMAKLGFPVLAVALPHKQKLVNELFNAQRAHSGVTVVPPSVAIRRCLERLRNNGAIALVADRDFGPHGLEMDFLNRRALLPKGPAILSLRTGAAILSTFFIRKPDGDFEIIIHEPIEPPFMSEQTVSDEVLRSMMRQYLKQIEEKIYQYPSQWLMFRPFWVESSISNSVVHN